MAYFYFSKDRINNGENRIYKLLLISNLIGLVLQLLCDYISRFNDIIPEFLAIGIYKFYLFSFLFFITLIILYVIEISFKKRNLWKTAIIMVLFISAFAILFLPIELHRDVINKIYFTYGMAVSYTFIISSLFSLLLFFMVLINIKKISLKKALPILLFLILIHMSNWVHYQFLLFVHLKN